MDKEIELAVRATNSCGKLSQVDIIMGRGKGSRKRYDHP